MSVRKCALTNESGYIFILTRPFSDAILGVFDRIEIAVKSIEMSHDAEIQWEIATRYGHSCEAACCLATGSMLCFLHKIGRTSIPLAFVL